MDIKVEVFSVGKWNGITFDKTDLMSMAAAFSKLKEFHKVPMKFGHNEEQPFTDGQPALGWVNDLEVVDDKLIANLSDVPELVFNAINANLYRHVSIELEFGVEHKGDYYPFVLSGIALLGADIPAVNNIGDLKKYMTADLKSSKRAAFTAANKLFKQEVDMDLKEAQAELEALKKQLSAKDSQISDLAGDKAKFEREKTDMAAKLKLQAEQAEKEKFSRKKTELTEAAEALVKGGKILPAQREEFMKQFKEDDSVIEMMESNLKVLGMFSKNDGDDGEQGGSGGDNDDSGENPAQVIFNRAKKYQENHPKATFSAATRAVMEADKELAKEYVMMT